MSYERFFNHGSLTLCFSDVLKARGTENHSLAPNAGRELPQAFGSTFSYVACNHETGAIAISNNDKHEKLGLEFTTLEFADLVEIEYLNRGF